ncbi:hypothetical protein C9374_014079 [Naegleria lovaniensis]|uniref:N-acetyltransferase domain-containing protein n=1 Tax=Naegleria lovaniensis TaxID=51637 RepID=A0AA88H116_NAELO|nr:uncharacterized protein C9374_014079 [Naegleria lovaniensis]KAG2389519.1 hypothetical protein C9374_014079 [Naegleria lovaniensis]
MFPSNKDIYLARTMQDAINMFVTCFGKEDTMEDGQSSLSPPTMVQQVSHDHVVGSISSTSSSADHNHEQSLFWREFVIVSHKTMNSNLMWKNLIMISLFLNDDGDEQELLTKAISTITVKSIPFMGNFKYSFLIPIPENNSFYATLREKINDINKTQPQHVEVTTAMYVTKTMYCQSLLGKDREIAIPSIVSHFEFLDKSFNMERYLNNVKLYSETHKIAYGDLPNERDVKFYQTAKFIIPARNQNGEENEKFAERLLVHPIATNDSQNAPVSCCAMFYDRKAKSAFLHDVTVRPQFRQQGLAQYMTKIMMERAFFEYGMESVTLTAVGSAKDIYHRKFGFEECGLVEYINKANE